MALKRKRDSTSSKASICVTKRKREVDAPKVHPLGTTLADLPYVIVNNILLKLPFESVCVCKYVCKSWHSIISSIMSDPHFAQLYFECAPITAFVRIKDHSRHVSRNLHLLNFDKFMSNEAHNLSSDNGRSQICSCKDFPLPDCDNHMKLEVKFKLPLRDGKMLLDTKLEDRRRGNKRTIIACKANDDKFDVVNSCNGLICLWNNVKRERDPERLCDRKTFVVCNPLTGEFIRLPQPETDIQMKLRHVYSGFGYLEKTNEYKVVRIFPCDMIHDEGVIDIYTLGTGIWRTSKYLGTWWTEIRSPTCLNGSLHWLVYNSREVSILCFDLESETHNSFSCPSAISFLGRMNTKSRICFGDFKGSLCICCPFENANHLGFWTMKKYGDAQSWTVFLNFNIEDFYCGPHLYQPMVHFGGSGILIYDPSGLFIYYDSQKHLLRFVEVRGTSFELEPIFHIPSLIRLKDVVKGNNIEVLNVHSRCATFKLHEDKEVLYLAKYKADMRIMNNDVWNF